MPWQNCSTSAEVQPACSAREVVHNAVCAPCHHAASRHHSSPLSRWTLVRPVTKLLDIRVLTASRSQRPHMGDRAVFARGAGVPIIAQSARNSFHSWRQLGWAALVVPVASDLGLVQVRVLVVARFMQACRCLEGQRVA